MAYTASERAPRRAGNTGESGRYLRER